VCQTGKAREGEAREIAEARERAFDVAIAKLLWPLVCGKC